MILNGPIRLLSYKKKNFKNEKGEEVPYLSADICDDHGNRFTVSVPKEYAEDVKIDVDTEGDPVEGNASLALSRATDKSGRAYTKIQLVAFKPE